jgi:acylphosphatase
MALRHWNFSIIGKVQGVWYRANTQETAQNLGLKGFVMNMSDGSVYIEAEGEEAKLEALYAWCKQGPEKAVVESVKLEEGEINGFEGFEIRH